MKGRVAKRGKSWIVVVDVGRDPNTGRRRQHFQTFRTKRDAEHRLGDLLKESQSGTYVKPTKQTTGEYLRQWLRDWAGAHTRARTAEGYAHKLERHVIPAIGAVELSALQPFHLQALYHELEESGRLDGKGGLSRRSVLHIHRILSGALQRAVKWGLLLRNVAQAVDPPRPDHREMLVLDGIGVRTVLAAVEGSVYYPLFLLALFSGLRRSELLGLRWKDVDLNLAIVRVVQVMHQLRDRRIVFEAPKTRKGRRQVDLPPTAVLALRAHRERVEAMLATAGEQVSPERLVFSHPSGRPLLPNSVTHAWIHTVRRVGYPGVRFHDARHTHASLLLKQNVHPKIVSERLGHANISITLDTYSHLLPGLQRAAALRFEEEVMQPKAEEVAS